MLTEFSEMLAEAMRRKAVELGAPRYTYRDLERDSGVHFTYAQKAVKYGRIPNRDIIAAWSRALFPYFPIEEALVVAYVPEGEGKRRLREAARGLVDRMLHHGLEHVPQPGTDADTGGEADNRGDAQ